MRDCLTAEERRAVERITQRQSELARIKGTELVRELLGQEVEKIRTAARLRAGFRWYGASL